MINKFVVDTIKIKNIQLQSKDLFFLAALVMGVLLIYWSLIFVFYQQDEWQGIGHLLLEGMNHPTAGLSFGQLILGEGRPLAKFLGLYFFGTQFLNSVPVALFVIFNHLLNSVLVFILGKNIAKSSLVAFIAALFFAFSSVSSNAITWFGTALGTLPATTLVILSLLMFLKFLENQQRKWLIWTFLLLYISLFFKEIGSFLFAILPFTSLLFRRYCIKSFVRQYAVFFLFFLIVGVFRVFELSAAPAFSTVDSVSANSSNNYLLILFGRLIFYPLTSFSLIYLPSSLMIDLGKFFTNLYYPFFPSEHYNLIVQTVVLDLWAVIFSFSFITLLYFSVKRFDSQTKRKIILLLLLFIFTLLPYILTSKTYAYLESRYYYLSGVPAGILLGWIFVKFWGTFTKVKITLALLFITVYFFVQIEVLNTEITHQINIGQERRSFFTQLQQIVPTLVANRNIFLIEGDKNFYVVGNKLPFQQGMGYTLMVLFYPSGKIPGELLKDNYLWDLNTQGYKQINGLGFGFFSEEEVLKKTLRENEIINYNLVKLYYDSSKKELKVF